MLETIPAPGDIVAFRVVGTLTGDDYDRCIDQIEARLAAHPRIAIVADLDAMTGLTPQALAKDLGYAVRKFGEYSRFARAAVVTDRRWLASVSELAGKVLPHSEVRAFEPGERELAMAWAVEFEPRSRAS